MSFLNFIQIPAITSCDWKEEPWNLWPCLGSCLTKPVHMKIPHPNRLRTPTANHKTYSPDTSSHNQSKEITEQPKLLHKINSYEHKIVNTPIDQTSAHNCEQQQHEAQSSLLTRNKSDLNQNLEDEDQKRRNQVHPLSFSITITSTSRYLNKQHPKQGPARRAIEPPDLYLEPPPSIQSWTQP